MELACRLLRNEVNSLWHAGLLTKAQLQAVLHDLGLLENKPAAFFSSSPGRPQSAVSPHTIRHAQQQARVVDRLWSCLHTSHSTDSTAANSNSYAAPTSGQTSHHPISATVPEAEADALLMEGLDVWEQLVGYSFSTPSSESSSASPPAASRQAHSDLSNAVHTRVDDAFRTAHCMQIHAAAGKHDSDKMTGVLLQQLLFFVQLVQQCSSAVAIQVVSQPMHTSAQHDAAELDRLARVCSRNKQNNMAYVSIGKSKMYRRPLRAISMNTPDQREGTKVVRQATHSPGQQTMHAGTRRWRPSGIFRIIHRQVYTIQHDPIRGHGYFMTSVQ